MCETRLNELKKLRYADLSEVKGYETDDALSGCTRKTPWPAEPFSTLTLPISPVTATTMGDLLNSVFTLLLPTEKDFIFVMREIHVAE